MIWVSSIIIIAVKLEIALFSKLEHFNTYVNDLTVL